MLRAVRELQDAGVEPDVWKVEGLDDRGAYVNVVEAARRDGRREVGWIVLARAENEEHVHAWLATAATVPGFTGFAVGRTTLRDALVAWRDGKMSREEAVAQIARRYREWVDLFEKARTA